MLLRVYFFISVFLHSLQLSYQRFFFVSIIPFISEIDRDKRGSKQANRCG